MSRFHVRDRLRQAAGEALWAWPKRLQRKLRGRGDRSVEAICHFRCPRCSKWFSIADAPWEKDDWFCPWCGAEAPYNPINN